MILAIVSGMELYHSGFIREAAHCLEAVVKEDPGNNLALIYLGMAYAAQGKEGAARACLQAAGICCIPETITGPPMHAERNLRLMNFISARPAPHPLLLSAK